MTTSVSLPILPFKGYFRDRLLNGTKIATTRNRRIGQAGDHFSAFGQTFKLTYVQAMPLKMVAQFFYLAEGFATPDEFIRCWEEIHPSKRYVPNPLVYFHLFHKVPEAGR